MPLRFFFYSYDNYDDHLGVNKRFDRLMPEDARVLDNALDGPIDTTALAKQLKVDEDGLLELLMKAKNARKIVDARNLAEGFREAVKQSIEYAVKEGIHDDKAIAALAGQICYRAADLGFLLKQRGEQLAKYSEQLRSEQTT